MHIFRKNAGDHTANLPAFLISLRKRYCSSHDRQITVHLRVFPNYRYLFYFIYFIFIFFTFS